MAIRLVNLNPWIRFANCYPTFCRAGKSHTKTCHPVFLLQYVDYFEETSFADILCLAPHILNCLKIGKISTAIPVNSYSTRGGTSA